jgi:phage replication O-like protein O
MEENPMLTGKEIQIEGGEYTRIHNAILETLSYARISGSEFHCVMFLFRKTYGWGKKDDRISLSQWADATKTKRPHVLAALNKLIKRKIIYKTGIKGQIPSYGFNKYIEEWEDIDVDSDRGDRFKNAKVLPVEVLVPKQVTVTNTGTSGVTKAGNETVTYIGTHKRKKETNKEIPDNNSHQLIFSALSKVCKVDPKLKGRMIGKIAKSLVGAGYTADDVNKFEFWWRGNDFRGKQGSPPTLNQVVELIMQSKSATAMPEKQSGTVRVILPSGEITEARR